MKCKISQNRCCVLRKNEKWHATQPWFRPWILRNDAPWGKVKRSPKFNKNHTWEPVKHFSSSIKSMIPWEISKLWPAVSDTWPDQINTSACVFLLTTCVRWAACCVWVQRWSGRRGKGCWILPGAAERSRWWTAADELAPPGWSWTPRPRTTSSPVATQNKHAQTSWLQKTRREKKIKILWLTFSLKCHDPPTITAWALKSCTFILPVPHINSWRG